MTARLAARLRRLERVATPAATAAGVLIVPLDPAAAERRITEALLTRPGPFIVVPEKAPLDPINAGSSR